MTATETARETGRTTLGLADLAAASQTLGNTGGQPQQAERELPQPQRDAQGRAYATGKRKDAIARVWIKPGKGSVTVNGRDQTNYFGRAVLRMMIEQPFQLTERSGQFDVVCTVTGGGLSGQAGAVRHGISKALTYYEPGLRTVLKRAGLITRDSRTVERKKYGRHGARRGMQWAKR